MNEKELQVLIRKYYEGNTSLEEEKVLSEHYDQIRAKEIGDASHAQFAYFRSRQREQPTDAFYSRMEAIVSGQTKGRQRTLSWIPRVAAAITMAATIAWLLLPSLSTPNEFATRAGEQREITLPDGTLVWLNANTQMEYENTFGTSVREVTLSGEAYFEVEPDPTKPFRIHLGNATVEVVGTSFNLRSYAAEPDIVLNVMTGMVRFGQREKIEVSRGNEAIYRISTGRLQPVRPLNLNSTAWKTRQLVFEDALLGNVASDLGKYFGKSIVIETPEVVDCHFTGSFQDPELEHVLEVIGYSLNVKYHINDQRIILRGQNCSSQ